MWLYHVLGGCCVVISWVRWLSCGHIMGYVVVWSYNGLGGCVVISWVRWLSCGHIICLVVVVWSYNVRLVLGGRHVLLVI